VLERLSLIENPWHSFLVAIVRVSGWIGLRLACCVLRQLFVEEAGLRRGVVELHYTEVGEHLTVLGVFEALAAHCGLEVHVGDHARVDRLRVSVPLLGVLVEGLAILVSDLSGLHWRVDARWSEGDSLDISSYVTCLEASVTSCCVAWSNVGTALAFKGIAVDVELAEDGAWFALSHNSCVWAFKCAVEAVSTLFC
jgi:hypothetical protein